jgi:hypothetical protein
MKMKLTLLALFVGICFCANAQTPATTEIAKLQAQINTLSAEIGVSPAVASVVYSNGIPAATNYAATPATTVSASNTLSQNIISVLESLGGLIAILVAIARALRKVIPDGAQANAAGVLLANLSGEVNPSVAKLAAAAVAPTAPPLIAPVAPVKVP